MKTAQHRFFRFACFLIAALLPLIPGNADPLQGRVEESQPGKSLEDALMDKLNQIDLQGSARNTNLTGNTAQTNLSAPLEGNTATNDPMRLTASNDPDGADQDLQIGWDRWRNSLTQAIQAGTINNMNVHNDTNFVFDPRRNMMVSRYPQGVSAWYSIDVLPDRRIVNIRLTTPSGIPPYDQCVLQAIASLQGNSLLRYPKGSKRQIVTQSAGVTTSTNSRFQNFKFGDVERQQVPGPGPRMMGQ